LLASYALGIAAVVAMALAWVGVQLAWRRVFPDACADPDVLAGRMGCHGCGRTEVCGAGAAEPTGVAQEEDHERRGDASG
jgi:hypothetical protein